MISLKEIAKQCGVSVATVSNIINGKTNVGEETRARILKVIEETGYAPNYMARGLRATKTQTIGLIIDDITSFGTPDLIEGIMGYFEKTGNKVVFENLRVYSKWPADYQNGTEAFVKAVNAAISQLLAIKVDGIIYISAHGRVINYVSNFTSVPFVICYGSSDVPDVPYVCIDDVKSSYDLVEYLISEGMTKFGVIASSKANIHGKERLDGYKMAMEKNNIAIDEKYIVIGKWDRKTGYECCAKLFEKGFHKESGKKVIFCFNDLMAAGVYDYLNEKNIKIGEEISVVGFDDREIAAFVNPPLTTMAIPLHEIGTKSAEMLVNKINGTELEKNNFSIPCRLIKRKSV